LKVFTACLLAVLATPAWSLDFASTAQPALMLDAPSETGTPLAIIPARYPLEVLVRTSDWLKVREAGGRIGWVAAARLGSKHYVIANRPVVSLYSQPRDDAPMVIQVAHDVLLGLDPGAPPGWLKVRHDSGRQGYVKVGDVWGN
jgi:SH3-like domain-containing protein